MTVAKADPRHLWTPCPFSVAEKKVFPILIYADIKKKKKSRVYEGESVVSDTPDVPSGIERVGILKHFGVPVGIFHGKEDSPLPLLATFQLLHH